MIIHSRKWVIVTIGSMSLSGGCLFSGKRKKNKLYLKIDTNREQLLKQKKQNKKIKIQKRLHTTNRQVEFQLENNQINMIEGNLLVDWNS